MKKKFWFLIIILLIIAGGFFYWWIPNHQANQSPEPPTLFEKGDYKVEDRVDGKYIVVDKVGLTAKVPDGWDIKKVEGSSYPKPGGWVELYSPDAEFKSILLVKGCGISIISGKAEEDYQEIQNIINSLKNNPDTNPEEFSYPYENYTLETMKINNYQVLKWITPEKEITGKIMGISIPVKKNNLVDITTSLPANYEEKCSSIWETFIENLKIK